jgi:hypothetical protein
MANTTPNDLNLTWDNLLLGQGIKLLFFLLLVLYCLIFNVITYENITGTLRPDLIESAFHMASSRTVAIKTRHNDSEMVPQLRIHGRVVEPIKGICIKVFPAL